MTSVYEAHGKYDVKVDPELCKAAVPWDGRRPGFHQCQRKATRDGWCHQHHPEAEAKRREKTRAEWEHKRNLRMLPWDKLEKANTLITHLEATNAELVAACEAADNFLSDDKCDRDLDPLCVAYNVVKGMLRAALAKAKGE